jgi:hypothetical protein
MTTARTKRSIIGALAIATLALTSCAGGGGTPSPTSSSTTPTAAPTPQQSLPPVSKEESIKSAQAAYKEYVDVYMAVGSEGGKNEEPLRSVSQSLIDGGHASDAFDSLKRTNSHFDGKLSYKYLSGEVTSFKPINGDAEVPLGQVDMSICLNKDDFRVVGADGAETGKHGPQQMLYSVRAIWYGERWLINRDWITDDKVTACDAS